MKFMQILYPGLGGTSTVAFAIVNSQKKTSLKIKNYFIFYGNEKLTKNNSDICDKNKIDFTFFLKRKFISDNLKIYKKIKSLQPDIILSHSNSLLALIIYKIFEKKKFYCVDHTPNKSKTIKNWINLFLFSIFSSGIVSVSKINKNDLIYKFYKFFNIKYRVIRNGINTDRFKRKKNILSKKKIRLGMAARFVNDKKQSLIIDTIIKNRNFFEKNNFLLTLAGSGYTQNILKKKVHQYRFNHLIKFEGNLDEKQLIKWFENIDIYFHLSIAETTSTVILQALSMSNPIFASKIEGNVQLKDFTRGKNLFLINNDHLSILKSFKYIIRNKSMLKKMSLNIRKDYVNKINSNNLFKDYYKFINF